jgi:outer membrane protein assembly complex protein YaeT
VALQVMRAWALPVLCGLLLAGCRSGPIARALCVDEVVPARVRIEGNEAVRDRELVEAAAFELEGIRERGEVHESGVADAAWSMERYLESRGYHGSKVDYALENGIATFRVRAGKLAYLRSVRLQGVHALGECALLEYFDFSGEGPLGLPPVLYDERALEDAAEEVVREYRANGFQDAEISGPHTTWSQEEGCADVVFVVTEGVRYCVCDVTFEGVTPCDVGVRGKPYRARLTTEAVGKVRSSLLARGYQFAEVEGSAKLDKETGCAHIHIEARPGPRVCLRCVRIRCLDRTSRAFVRSLVPVRPGCVLRQSPIDCGVERLYRAGIFRSVDAHVERVGPATADLVVEVPELEARSIEVEAGWGSYELARGAVRFQDRNLFGIGRWFRSEVRAHTKGGELDVELIDPWILGPRRQLRLEFGLIRRKEPSYTFEGIRFGVAVEDRVCDWLTLRSGYRFRSEKAFAIRAAVPAAERTGFVNTAGFFGELEVDTRDSVLLPTSGTLATAGMFWSAPAFGADLNYLEYVARVTHHVPLGRPVLAVGASFRVKDVLSGPPTLPIQERYFLGGETSVRSFEESELGPVDAQGDPVGGLTSAQAHAELRFPLIGDLHGAAFYDIGVVNPRSFDFSGSYGHAVGLGLRYYFPFGPLRVDYAYGPGTRFAADDDWALHIALGFPF